MLIGRLLVGYGVNSNTLIINYNVIHQLIWIKEYILKFKLNRYIHEKINLIIRKIHMRVVFDPNRIHLLNERRVCHIGLILCGISRMLTP